MWPDENERRTVGALFHRKRREAGLGFGTDFLPHFLQHDAQASNC